MVGLLITASTGDPAVSFCHSTSVGTCLQAPAEVPVSLQVGNGTPVSLAPIIQSLGSMLGSAIHSAVASASPASAAGAPAASAAPATTAPAAAPAAAGSSSHQSSQSAGTRLYGNPNADPASLLAPPVMHQVLHALMHAISPFVNGQGPQQPPSPAAATAGGAAGNTAAAATSDTAAADAAASNIAAGGPGAISPPGTASASDIKPVPLGESHSAAGTASNAPAAAATASGGAGSSRPASQRPLGMSEPLSEMIGGSSAPDGPSAGSSSVQNAQELISALMTAGASSVNVSGPIPAPDRHRNAQTEAIASTSENPPVPAAASPADNAKSDAAGGDSSAQQSDATAGVSKLPGQRGKGLGPALPPRDRGSKNSHPRSPVPGLVPSYSEEAAHSNRQTGSRPAPTSTQQDNVKRARRGDTTSEPGAAATAGAELSAAVEDATATGAVLTEERQIAQPSGRAVQAGSAGGLDALMAQMFGGGGGGPSGSSGSGGLNLNSLMQVCPSHHS